jgi:hypothetical protein
LMVPASRWRMSGRDHCCWASMCSQINGVRQSWQCNSAAAATALAPSPPASLPVVTRSGVSLFNRSTVFVGFSWTPPRFRTCSSLKLSGRVRFCRRSATPLRLAFLGNDSDTEAMAV